MMSSAAFSLESTRRNVVAARLCGADELPSYRRPRFVVAQAFAETLERSFSGTTYYLTETGRARGKLEGCFSLFAKQSPDNKLRALGAIWKLGRLARGQKPEGFKFSDAALRHLWRTNIQHFSGTSLLNNFQLYGSWFHEHRATYDIEANYYIDGTLQEYFDSYGEFDASGIDRATIEAAIAVERDGYLRADRIIVMSRRSAETLRSSYGVAAHKVFVVPPGANLLDESVSRAAQRPRRARSEPFVLGFVGMYPERKGLPKLVEAITILRSRGLDVRVRVLGRCTPDLRTVEGVDYVGEVDKLAEPERFLEQLCAVDLGCLLSQAELAGIAVVEFLRLGIPVLGTDVGGTTDILEGGGALMVPADISAAELAEELAPFVRDRERYEALKQQAESRRAWASWSRAVNDIDRILAQPIED
jgi:glycosyltransferase involved in cell wall biosynthesis